MTPQDDPNAPKPEETTTVGPVTADNPLHGIPAHPDVDLPATVPYIPTVDKVMEHGYSREVAERIVANVAAGRPDGMPLHTAELTTAGKDFDQSPPLTPAIDAETVTIDYVPRPANHPMFRLKRVEHVLDLVLSHMAGSIHSPISPEDAAGLREFLKNGAVILDADDE